MPTILLKKSDTASAVPTTANLTNLAGGVEVAVNTADRRMFTMTSASAVVELGNNPTSLNITTGNLAFTGTGQRITGDMSNATWSSRVSFQTSTTNGNTNIPIIPNGTGVNSLITLINNSDPTNAGAFSIGIVGSTDARINASILGTGTYLPMTFYTGGSERMRLDTSGNLGVGLTPTYKFEVLSSSSDVARFTVLNKTIDGTGNLQVFTSTNQAADVGGSIALGGKNGSGGAFDPWAFGVIKGAKENSTSSNLAGYIAFATANSGGTVAERMRIDSSGNVGIGKTASTNKLEVSGTISDVAGNVRAIPRTGSAKTSVYTLSISDVGQFVELGTGGGIDVPNGVFSTGDVVSVFNNTTGNRTISLTITTAYIGGTDSDKASVTLATRGVATVLFISNSVCVVNGNVS